MHFRWLFSIFEGSYVIILIIIMLFTRHRAEKKASRHFWGVFELSMEYSMPLNYIDWSKHRYTLHILHMQRRRTYTTCIVHSLSTTTHAYMSLRIYAQWSGGFLMLLAIFIIFSFLFFCVNVWLVLPLYYNPLH